MLNNVLKACQVLYREGVLGAANRILYRHDKFLMHERANQPNRMFMLEGEGMLKRKIQAELARRNLLAPAFEPTVHRILLNPTLLELEQESISALVFEDTYLDQISSCEQQLRRSFGFGYSLVVTSEAGLRRVVEIGASLHDIMLVPIDSHDRTTQLALSRWLVYMGALRPEDYLDDLLAFGPSIYDQCQVCISLPEHQHRRAGFLKSNQMRYIMFDGIRLLPGWKGAAWSYKAVAAKALQSGAQRITVCEDDAVFASDFNHTFNILNYYLDKIEWDVFNGVMTRLPRHPKITIQGKLGSSQMFHAKHMMGMVFNIYNRPALEWLANWNPNLGGSDSNTIDEWLNTMPDLKVVSAVPFLAGHREDTHSTIFGFKNTRYKNMIQATERELLSLIK